MGEELERGELFNLKRGGENVSMQREQEEV